MKAYFFKRNLAVAVLLAVIFGSVYVVIANNPDRLATGGHSADDGHGHSQDDGHGHTKEEMTATQARMKGSAAKVKIDEIKTGTGPAAADGDLISVHYTGTLEDGSVFDSSLRRGEPFELTLGHGQVIPGWEIGLRGMKQGGKRKLTIPPDLAYGEASPDPQTIPPNATLIFEVELLKVEKPKAVPSGSLAPGG